MTETSGCKIEFWESGAGTPILFVPGSFSTAAAWRPLQNHLPGGFRFVGTSLCGYGGTAETRRFDDHDMDHEIAVIEAAARRIGEPIHLVGHSFGGTVALATALKGRLDVLSLATFEANPLNLMRESGAHDLYASVRRTSDAFEQAQRSGERNAAGRIIDFWGGEGSFGGLPEGVQDYCRLTAPTNVLDWHTAFGFQLTVEAVSRLEIPVLVARGAMANEAMVVISDTFSEALPNSETEIVEGASHFLISTHASECARLLCRFLDA